MLGSARASRRASTRSTAPPSPRFAGEPGVRADARRGAACSAVATPRLCRTKRAPPFAWPCALARAACGCSRLLRRLATRRRALRPRLTARARSVARELAGATGLARLDPRCALELRELAPTTLVELAARNTTALQPAPRSQPAAPLPRQLRARSRPRPVRRAAARCWRASRAPRRSSSRQRASSRAAPAAAVSCRSACRRSPRRPAERLLAEHERLGGGTLVTAAPPASPSCAAPAPSAVDLISCSNARASTAA